MANPDPLFAGTGDPVQIDPVFGPDGTVYLKAAGDSEGVPTGASDPAAPQLVQLTKSDTATSTRVSSSATSVTLQASNVSRKGIAIYNESTQVLYVRLAAAAASATAYWLAMAANSYAEVPFWYTGEIRGIWASANGAAMVTEIM